MGQYESGKTVLWLSVYFICFILGMALLQAGFTAMGLDYSFVSSEDETFLSGLVGVTDVCVDPRYYTTDDGSREEIGTYQSNSALCRWTDGNVDATSCNAIAGCTWEDVSTIFFFFTRDAYCDGTVQLTNYSSFTNQTNDYFKSIDSVHDPDTIYITNGQNPQFQSKFGDYVTQDICELGESKQACDMLGCTWTDVDDIDTSVGVGTIIDITAGLFTFNVTFTDEYWTNLMLTLILFYIPLLAYIIAIYFALPFIH